MKWLKKLLFRVAMFLKEHAIDVSPASFGDSMNFLGKTYYRELKVPCNINDEVIIHPVPRHSQATISYPAKIVAIKEKGRDGRADGTIWVLMVDGIRGNKHRGWINEYLFSRLEFVLRNCKEKSSWEQN